MKQFMRLSNLNIVINISKIVKIEHLCDCHYITLQQSPTISGFSLPIFGSINSGYDVVSVHKDKYAEDYLKISNWIETHTI